MEDNYLFERLELMRVISELVDDIERILGRSIDPDHEARIIQRRYLRETGE